ncbi:hypothetical protein Emed_001785 [Eimeria media]
MRRIWLLLLLVFASSVGLSLASDDAAEEREVLLDEPIQHDKVSSNSNSSTNSKSINSRSIRSSRSRSSSSSISIKRRRKMSRVLDQILHVLDRIIPAKNRQELFEVFFAIILVVVLLKIIGIQRNIINMKTEALEEARAQRKETPQDYLPEEDEPYVPVS